MPYLLKESILADIPGKFLVQALDDDGDGVEDEGLWDIVLGSVEISINGTLGQRYPVPFAEPIPAIVADAARVLMLEKLYLRRGIPSEQNPWVSQANRVRSQLAAIAAGDQPLTPEIKKTSAGSFILKEASGTHLSSGAQLA